MLESLKDKATWLNAECTTNAGIRKTLFDEGSKRFSRLYYQSEVSRYAIIR